MGSRKTNFYVDLTHRFGFGEVADQVQGLYLDGKREEAYNAIPDELVNATSLVGTEDEVAEKIRPSPRPGSTGSSARRSTSTGAAPPHGRASRGAVDPSLRRWWPGPAPPTHCFITGAGSGIGAATAERSPGRAGSLALVDLDANKAQAIAQRCGQRQWLSVLTSRTRTSMEAAVAATVERFGGIDLCFANAGIATEGSLRHTDPEVFAVQVDVNLVGTYRTVHACLPHLIASKGYMLLNASASAVAAPPGLGAYGASKAGVENLGDTLRRELQHLGVDVGVVYLLWVSTDMVEGAEAHGEIFKTMRAASPARWTSWCRSRKPSTRSRRHQRRARRVSAPRGSWAPSIARGGGAGCTRARHVQDGTRRSKRQRRERASKGQVRASGPTRLQRQPRPRRSRRGNEIKPTTQDIDSAEA